MELKLLPQDGELYVFAQSRDRVAKERAMRRRQLKWLWKRLAEIAAMKLTREELLMKLGAQPCPDGLAFGGRQSAEGQHDVELSAQPAPRAKASSNGRARTCCVLVSSWRNPRTFRYRAA